MYQNTPFLDTQTNKYTPILCLYSQINIFFSGLETISDGEKCLWIRTAYDLSQRSL